MAADARPSSQVAYEAGLEVRLRALREAAAGLVAYLPERTQEWRGDGAWIDQEADGNGKPRWGVYIDLPREVSDAE